MTVFIGAGFVGGSIVHYPISPLRSLIIGLLGATLFAVASTLNEMEKPAVSARNIVQIAGVSLLLSVGIGMVSGGIQHFAEYPVYGSYLIPLGVVVSMIAFVFRDGAVLLKKAVAPVMAGTVLVSAVLGIILIPYAKTLTTEPHAHDEAMTDHADMVSDDRSFIEHMVPHHTDAVTASQVVVERSTNPKVRALASKIIAAQNLEISSMKQWYQEWYGVRLPSTTSYTAMMSNYRDVSSSDVDVLYLREMITHHQSAVVTAEKALKMQGKEEIQTLARNIVTTQQAEITEMQALLPANSSSVTSSPMDHTGH